MTNKTNEAWKVSKVVNMDIHVTNKTNEAWKVSKVVLSAWWRAVQTEEM